MAGKATLRTRQAGRVVEQVSYPHVSKSDSERVRGEKKKKTSEVMQRYNKTASVKKFELMLAANFIPGDIVGCVTYDDAHEPTTRKEANARFKYFREKLRKLSGVDRVFFWSTEHRHGEGRWHHHFVCTATGRDYEDIRRAWIYGSVARFDALRVDEEKNYATLARYFAKEAREKVGLRSWSYTVRTAKKPVEDVDIVEAGTELSPPPGVTVLDRHVTETLFGVFRYLKYLLPADPAAPRVYANRRRE